MIAVQPERDVVDERPVDVPEVDRAFHCGSVAVEPCATSRLEPSSGASLHVWVRRRP
jgi:hypothetical protein